MLILHVSGSVIIEGIRFSCIHVDEGHRFVVQIRGQNDSRIRRIKAAHGRERKAGIHHILTSVFILGPSDVAGL